MIAIADGRVCNAVNLMPGNLYQRIELRQLLTREWDLVRQHARFVASGVGLSIAPSADAGETELPGHDRLIRLHADAVGLGGHLRCHARSLPFEDDSLQLVVARHASDCLGRDSGVEAELARIVAPGGLLMVFGFNPVSSWRPWWAARARDGMSVPSFRSMGSMRRLLVEQNLQMGRGEYLGGFWPSTMASESVNGARTSAAFWQGVWLLKARKQHLGMHPIPLRTPRRRPAMNPGLLQSSSRQAAA
jgi:hypothetical protein